MFKEKEIKNIYDLLTDEIINNDYKLKYIDNKIKKHGYLYINIQELNYVYNKTNTNTVYDVSKLKDIFTTNNIGYTSLIKNIGIAKATLSKMLNKDRNVRLSQLNDFIDKVNSIYKLKITKDLIKEGD